MATAAVTTANPLDHQLVVGAPSHAIDHGKVAPAPGERAGSGIMTTSSTGHSPAMNHAVTGHGAPGRSGAMGRTRMQSMMRNPLVWLAAGAVIYFVVIRKA